MATTVNGNNSAATAYDLFNSWSLAFDPNVTDSSTVPHASVYSVTEGGMRDWYVFTLTATTTVTFDIDGGMPDIDSWLSLYNSSMGLIGQVDDAAIDPGSVHGFDSFWTISLPAGSYFLEVSRYPHSDFFAGADYTLNFSALNVVDTTTAPTAPVDTDAAGDIAGANATIAEDLAIGSAIGLDAHSTDLGGGAVSYSFGFNPDTSPILVSGPFTIDATTGVVTLTSALDYETTTSYALTIHVRDLDGETASSPFTVNVTNVNEAPNAVNDVLGIAQTIELIANGGFETGSTGWTLTNGGSGGWSVESDTLPPSGVYTTPGPQAGLNYIVTWQTGPGVHAMEQSFTVPAGTLSVTLSYAMFAQTSGGQFINAGGLDHNAFPNQHARVDLLTAGSGALSTSGADVIQNYYIGIDGIATQPWTLYTFDITGSVTAGGTFDLRFAQVDNQNFFNLGVDAVSVSAEVLGALTDEDTAVSIQTADLLANDTDPDGDTLTVTGVSALSTLGAAMTLNGDGTISYDPTGALDFLAEGVVVEDTFTYTIDDGNGGTDTATVSLRVLGINDAPSAPVDGDGPSGASISEHHTVGTAIGLDADSTDPEGDAINYFFRDGVGNAVQTLGKFTIDAATGVVTLAAAVNYELETSYSLTIYASDGSDESSSVFAVDVTNVVEHLFTPGNDGTGAAPINFNTLPDGAYDYDGAQYDALAGDDFVILPNLATSALPGHAWDYNTTFVAGAGNDVIQGGDGNDIISGGDGNDKLYGADGDDRLVGSAGDDILAGGDGSDKMTGSSGRDIFLFTDSEIDTTKAGEHDVITDFQQGTDKIDISALYDNGVTYGGLKSGALTGHATHAYKAGFYSASGKTWLEGDVTGDGLADWVIEMSGSYKLKGTDVIVSNSLITTEAQWNTANPTLDYASHHQDYYLV